MDYPQVHRLEVVETGRRRRWSAERKRAIVAESFAPGVTASSVARRHGISPGHLFLWRKAYRDGGEVGATPGFVPVRLEAPAPLADRPCGRMEIVAANGSAAQGDPVHATGVAIGKLLRSIYLCDYFAKPDFQHAILDLLNQGEAVHSLQRAIHPGTIGAKHGRSFAEIAAISGALTLLTNIVMAWNTMRIQGLSERYPDEFPDSITARLAPIGHAHINMHGIIAFKLGAASRSLIVSSKATFYGDDLAKADS